MKLNWGNWIAVAYSAFVLLIVFMVYMAFGEKWDLVAEDYYDQEIKFQQTIDSKANVSEAGLQPKIYIEHEVLKIQFPESNIASVMDSGRVDFFRPSDAEKDVSVSFKEAVSGNQITVPLQILSKGKYLAKMSWMKDDKNYYYEQNLIIP